MPPQFRGGENCILQGCTYAPVPSMYERWPVGDEHVKNGMMRAQQAQNWNKYRSRLVAQMAASRKNKSTKTCRACGHELWKYGPDLQQEHKQKCTGRASLPIPKVTKSNDTRRRSQSAVRSNTKPSLSAVGPSTGQSKPLSGSLGRLLKKNYFKPAKPDSLNVAMRVQGTMDTQIDVEAPVVVNWLRSNVEAKRLICG